MCLVIEYKVETETSDLKITFKDHLHCTWKMLSNLVLKVSRDQTTFIHNLSCTSKYNTHKAWLPFLLRLEFPELLMYYHRVIDS